ncbi:alpha/beta hydrolase [Rhodobacteraceae bacterium]|nr:alpha/beta hydrolase [Paracoccaceae bacterium]
MTKFLTTHTGQKLAYSMTKGNGPSVIFLGGFKSDMEGSKAIFLEKWARQKSRSFLRFDYSGHGQSSGDFLSLGIGDWFKDSMQIIELIDNNDLILVGSSMGGWISLLLSRELGKRLKGLVTIAAAPDFTEDSMWRNFTEEQKSEVLSKGIIYLPSEYGEPYPITRYLIEDGRQNLILREPLDLQCPVRLMQGTEDTAVTRETALKLFDHINGNDLSLFFKRGADHSFSDQGCLEIIEKNLENILEAF